MANTLKTIIHTFHFDLRKTAEKESWLALRTLLKGGPREMESHGGASHWHNQITSGSAITLETKHLFSNQWNTSADSEVLSAYRVFDFAFDYKPNGNGFIRRGHWLEQTKEMQELRANTCACRYCGKQEPAQKGYVFCPYCIGSEYLTEDKLFLTRMLPVYEPAGFKIPPLSDSDRAYLMPLFIDAQTNGNNARDKKRIAQKRADILKSKNNAIFAAQTEFDGFTWLMDNGIKTDNCIYYKHTNKFSFGWREKLSEELVQTFRDKLNGFPFDYTVETANK